MTEKEKQDLVTIMLEVTGHEDREMVYDELFDKSKDTRLSMKLVPKIYQAAIDSERKRVVRLLRKELLTGAGGQAEPLLSMNIAHNAAIRLALKIVRNK